MDAQRRLCLPPGGHTFDCSFLPFPRKTSNKERWRLSLRPFAARHTFSTVTWPGTALRAERARGYTDGQAFIPSLVRSGECTRPVKVVLCTLPPRCLTRSWLPDGWSPLNTPPHRRGNDTLNLALWNFLCYSFTT